MVVPAGRVRRVVWKSRDAAVGQLFLLRTSGGGESSAAVRAMGIMGKSSRIDSSDCDKTFGFWFDKIVF